MTFPLQSAAGNTNRWVAEMDVPYKLYKGDCLEIMPTLEAGSVDAIITDLPYGTTACAWDSIIPFAPMWEQVKRVLKPSGAFITTGSQPFTSVLIASNLEMFKYEWIWNKVKPSGFPSAKLKPLKQHENILVFSEGATANGSSRNMVYNPQMRKAIQKNVRPINNGSSLSSAVFDKRKNTREAKSDIDYDPTKRYPYSILEYSGQEAECNNGNREHPTQKPLALYKYLVETYTNFGDVVLDICMGSGTTIEAAIRTGRKSIGIEKEQAYYSIAESRAKLAVLQPALFHATQQSMHPTRAGVPKKFDNFE